MSVRARVSSGDPVTSDISRSPQAPCPPTNSQVTALHHDLAAPLAGRGRQSGTPPVNPTILTLPRPCAGGADEQAAVVGSEVAELTDVSAHDGLLDGWGVC